MGGFTSAQSNQHVSAIRMAATSPMEMDLRKPWGILKVGDQRREEELRE